MAIDRVQEFAFAFPHRQEGAALSRLFDAGIVHLTGAIGVDLRASSAAPSASATQTTLDADVLHIAEALVLTDTALAFLDEQKPSSRGLVQSFFPNEVYVTATELVHTSSRDYTPLLHEILALRDSLSLAHRQRAEMKNELAKLYPWSGVPMNLSETGRSRWLALFFGVVPSSVFAGVAQTLQTESITFSMEIVFESRTSTGFVVASRKSDIERVRGILTASGVKEEVLAGIRTTVASAIEGLEDDVEALDTRIFESKVSLAEMLAKRQDLVIYREFLRNEQHRIESAGELTRTGRRSIATGYVREADREALGEVCATVDGAAWSTGEPSAGDSTPVSISNSKWLRPMEILINMFGYPVRSTFDPTVFLAIPFLLFYGLCLGDVLYGAIQIGICLYFMRKYKQSVGVHNFMMVFLYGGVAAMVGGALTGSWGGDLLSETYLGKGNAFSGFVRSLTIIDPLQSAFQFLVIVWVIGALNQFYGVGLAIYKAARRHDYATIVYDCVGWLLLLPAVSALLFIGAQWGTAFRSGYLIALATGTVLLFLGGARQGKGVGKVLMGLVNLYGIQSSYGAGSFLGDVLSYSRLLALGLTTSMLGSAFNMIGSLVKIPVLGLLLGGAVVLFGHALNYFMGTMGAFIHSARLILLEFFGRFYEGGAPRFHRFGFWSEVVKVVDTSTVLRK
jgi:V/A-type H+-transporting ATPase subunit I